jgi:hypothetical protein
VSPVFMCLGFRLPGWWDSVAGYSDQLQAGGYGVGTPAGARYFSRTVQTVCKAHPFSFSVSTGIPSRWKVGAQVTTDLPPTPTLRMCGAVHLPVCLESVDSDDFTLLFSLCPPTLPVFSMYQRVIQARFISNMQHGRYIRKRWW